MIEIFLCKKHVHQLGLPMIPPQKPLVYSRGMKKLFCKAAIPLKFLAGFPASKKKIAYLESIGLTTIEDLFFETPKTLERIVDKRLNDEVLIAWQKIQARQYLYEDSVKKGTENTFTYLKELIQVKHLNREEKAIIVGLAVFSPLLKITRQSLVAFKATLPFFEDKDFHSITKKKIVKKQIRIQRKKILAA